MYSVEKITGRNLVFSCPKSRIVTPRPDAPVQASH